MVPIAPPASALPVKADFTIDTIAAGTAVMFVASFSLMLCLVFFAFTTILGWDYYGERCLEYLFNRNKAAVTTYRWLYIICVFIGPYMTVAAVWNIADIFNALMAFPNLIALLALSGVVVKETKDFFKRHKNYEF